MLFKGEKLAPAGTTVITPNTNDDTPLTITNADGTTVATVSKTGVITSGTGNLPALVKFTVDSELLAASVDKHIWIAPVACKAVSVKEIHSVAGGAAAAVRPRKILAASVSAPGAAAGANVKELTTAACDLTTTADTVVAATLSATPADYTFAAGDKLSLDFSGTLTGLVGYIVIELQAV